MQKEDLQKLIKAQPTLKEKLTLLFPLIAQVGQEEYDAWEQDEEGYDVELGGGGICHLIAEEVADTINEYIPEGLHTTQSATHMQHVYVVSFLKGKDGEIEGYSVDISPYLYEEGGGFCWRKLPDVEFQADWVELYPAELEDQFDEFELEELDWWIHGQ